MRKAYQYNQLCNCRLDLNRQNHCNNEPTLKLFSIICSYTTTHVFKVIKRIDGFIDTNNNKKLSEQSTKQVPQLINLLRQFTFFVVTNRRNIFVIFRNTNFTNTRAT